MKFTKTEVFCKIPCLKNVQLILDQIRNMLYAKVKPQFWRIRIENLHEWQLNAQKQKSIGESRWEKVIRNQDTSTANSSLCVARRLPNSTYHPRKWVTYKGKNWVYSYPWSLKRQSSFLLKFTTLLQRKMQPVDYSMHRQFWLKRNIYVYLNEPVVYIL